MYTPIAVKELETEPLRRDDGALTDTFICLYPEKRELRVEQVFLDVPYPAAVWHGRVLRWQVGHQPDKDALRRWIDANLGAFSEINAGYTVAWDGRVHVGRITLEAQELIDDLTDDLHNNLAVLA